MNIFKFFLFLLSFCILIGCIQKVYVYVVPNTEYIAKEVSCPPIINLPYKWWGMDESWLLVTNKNVWPQGISMPIITINQTMFSNQKGKNEAKGLVPFDKKSIEKMIDNYELSKLGFETTK